MRSVSTLFLATLLALPGLTLARDAGDYATSAGISASLYSTFKDDKLVVAAREDAGAFVASAGAVRGAYLEAALLHLRETRPELAGHSDLELAAALLATPQE
ncbi:MAG TPA: DUF2388 domain-containing protein [Pseudomonas sp.]|nr:DUF2388 domain-containing protein [Pseudomonas sp.]